MQPRIEYDKLAPGGTRAMWGLEKYVRDCGLEPPLRGDLLALRDAVRRLLVEQRGILRGAAPLGQRLHDHDTPVRAGRDLDLVARPDLLAGLDALAVDLDAPALDRLRRLYPGAGICAHDHSGDSEDRRLL